MNRLFYLMYFLMSGDEFDLLRRNFLGPDAYVFQDTIVFSILLAGVIAAIYYLILNRFFSMQQNWMWGIFLALSGLVGCAIAYSLVGTFVYPVGTRIELLGIKFIMMSSFYSLLYFFIWSLILKKWSNFASRTPF